MKKSIQDNIMIQRLLPANFGPLKGANASARISGQCGDTMEFWLNVHEGLVCNVTFTTDGCKHSLLCGSAAANLVKLRTLEVADLLTQADVLQAAGNIPRESHHCALLAANTLKAAIAGYRAKYEQP